MFHSLEVKMQMESPHLAAGSGTQTRTRQCAPKKFKFHRPVLPSFAVGTLCHCRRSEEANGAIFLWAECLRVLNGRFLLFFVSIASTLQSIRRGWFDRSSRGRVATFFWVGNKAHLSAQSICDETSDSNRCKRHLQLVPATSCNPSTAEQSGWIPHAGMDFQPLLPTFEFVWKIEFFRRLPVSLRVHSQRGWSAVIDHFGVFGDWSADCSRFFSLSLWSIAVTAFLSSCR